MAKKQSKTEVSLFDFYESTTEGVFDKSYHPYKAFPIKKIKAFKLPKSNFKKFLKVIFSQTPRKKYRLSCLPMPLSIMHCLNAKS